MTERLTVRMYCQGFGDCFLLTVAGEGGPYRAVIDCGVVRNTKREKDRMIEVVQNLYDATGGVIDVLIITHEHWDHVCGFGHASDLWKRFKIKQLWLSWTEDHEDEAAGAVAKYHRDAYGLARRAEGALQGLALGTEGHARLESLLGLLPAYSPNTGTTLKDIVETAKASGARVSYLRPGATITLGAARVAVLGPPRDKDKLKNLLGSSGDTFGHLAALAEDAGIPAASSYEDRMRAALGLAPKAPPPGPPFAPTYVLRPNDKGRWKQYAEGKTTGTRVDQRYEADENAWRRIDAEGLAAFQRLAMQLDSLTNNLSLALAFVVGEDVLLFPGDAQMGNWKSWGDQTYTLGLKEWTVLDLMRKTRVYKAGHHASHNGTCRPDRFDLMPEGLISLVPFEPVAHWPSIPELSLVAALESRGPVARADGSGEVRAPFRQGPRSEILDRPLWVEVGV